MKTKILYLLFVLLMCFCPAIVFADSIYYEAIHDGALTIVEIDEDRKLICKDEYGYDLTKLELNLSRRDAQKMMEYFKSYINEDDIVEYAPNKHLEDYGDGNYLDNLRICSESECKEYFSENQIIPKEETDYGEIYKLRKKENTKFAGALLLSIAFIIVIPIIVIASIVLLIVFLCLKKNKR